MFSVAYLLYYVSPPFNNYFVYVIQKLGGTVSLRQRSDCHNLPGSHIAQLSLQFSDMYLCFDKQSPENAHVLH